jgi:hypothetical protein
VRSRRPLRELVVARVWWILPAGAVAVLVAMLVVQGREETANRDAGFPSEDIDAARLRILPYRQSGLIFSWPTDGAIVFVKRSMWDGLPEDSRRDLGQAMAVAKDVRAVRIIDAESPAVLEICTAEGRCRSPSLSARRTPTKH